MKKLFLLALAAFAFMACADDTDWQPVKLATPTITYEATTPSEVKMMWTAIEHASAYIYTINDGAPQTTKATQVTFDPKGTECKFTVKAVSNEPMNYLDSDVATSTISGLKITEKIDFEAAELGTDGFIWGKPLATEQDDIINEKPAKSNIFYGSLYEEKMARVYSYFTDYGGSYDTWNGFIVSNHTDMETEGYLNDKSVYATGGADGSKQFATACHGAWTPNGQGVPTLKFTSEVSMRSVAVANSTYAYLYFQNDVTDPEKPEFKLVITGYNGDKKGQQIEYVLAGGKEIKSGWETIDLKGLGTVTSLDFTIECADYNAPYYFCIDNLVYVK